MTSPSAVLTVSKNGGSAVTGPIVGAVGDTIRLRGQSTSGWTANRFEIYSFPDSFSPGGTWTQDDSLGTVTGVPLAYYNATTTPSDFTVTPWGKYLWRLKINNATVGANAANLIDDTGGVRIDDPSTGLVDIAAFEDGRFHAQAWPEAGRKNLRTTAVGGSAVTRKTVSGTVAAGAGIVISGSSASTASAAGSESVRALHGVALAGASGGSLVPILTNGGLDPSIRNLGAGAATAVGINSSGVPVRVTDPTCVSGLYRLGWCDASGSVFVQPHRARLFDALDHGLVRNDSTAASANVAAFNALMTIVGNVQGGEVYFPEGTWWFNDTVGPVPDNTWVHGVVDHGEVNAHSVTEFRWKSLGTGLGKSGLRVHNEPNANSGSTVRVSHIRFELDDASGQGTRQALTLSMTGTNGTVIPAGSRVCKANDTSVIFRLVAQTTLGAGPTTALFRSTETGYWDVPIHSLTQIMDPVTGWDNSVGTVTNNTAADNPYGSPLTLPEIFGVHGCAAIDVIGGQGFEFDHLRFHGAWRYGVVLDGAERVHVHHSTFDNVEVNGGANPTDDPTIGVWMVGDDTYAHGFINAFAGSTNVVDISTCLFNSTISVWDHGGDSHHVHHCTTNNNGGGSGTGCWIRQHGPQNSQYTHNHIEAVAPAQATILVTAGGVNVTVSDNILIDNNGDPCINFQGGGAAHWVIENNFVATASPFRSPYFPMLCGDGMVFAGSNITGNGQTVSVNGFSYSATPFVLGEVGIQFLSIGPAFVGTMVVESTTDGGATWQQQGANVTIDGSRQVQINGSGINGLRVRSTAWTSGTCLVSWNTIQNVSTFNSGPFIVRGNKMTAQRIGPQGDAGLDLIQYGNHTPAGDDIGIGLGRLGAPQAAFDATLRGNGTQPLLKGRLVEVTYRDAGIVDSSGQTWVEDDDYLLDWIGRSQRVFRRTVCVSPIATGAVAFAAAGTGLLIPASYTVAAVATVNFRDASGTVGARYKVGQMFTCSNLGVLTAIGSPVTLDAAVDAGTNWFSPTFDATAGVLSAKLQGSGTLDSIAVVEVQYTLMLRS